MFKGLFAQLILRYNVMVSEEIFETIVEKNTMTIPRSYVQYLK